MSDRSDSEVRLPRAAEDLLASWPVAERDERAWEESAEAILTRVEIARPGSTDDALLAAPLPSEVGEGSIKVARSTPRPAVAQPPAAPVSLADLARSALANDEAASSTDIARETLSLASRSRSAPAIADEPSAAISGPVSTPSAIPAPPPSVVQASLPVLQPKRSKVAPLFATGVALIGMAAAVVIVLRSQQAREAPTAALPAPAADHAPEPAADHAPEPAAAATAEVEKKTDLEIETPESLAQAQPESAPGAPRPAAKAAPLPAPPKGETAGKEANNQAPAPTEAQPTAPSEPDKDQKEASKMKPAAQPTDLPLQPSNGAVQAAVAQVIGSARACVAGHDEPSRASIVFGSDGRVQSVSVSGPAAGTPAESCIRSALSRARVEPFAKPTFSVGTTIRP